MNEDILATQTISLKGAPKKDFIINVTGILTTKYGEVLPFSYARKGEVHLMSNYYSGFYLLTPTV
ncbi:hypothetical protein NJD71_05990 [Psychrobacter sp. PP-21]|uniref:hypothetical protein n=1 Tax=Psychrobacter sp. PP-21 TaxID=2957503 RepID=UPI0029B79D7D|nr:hypothetical protein [Psychrobacter sp. PP-21]MDX2373678.1 hypothetical protein [Psychrobacter sp. PP-21]